MWEYKTETLRGDRDFAFGGNLGKLNSLGQEGWEVVGMTPVSWEDRGGMVDATVAPTVGVLLKRRIAE
jgi:hypothetical protein